MKKIILLFILIPGISFGGTMNMIGEKGDPTEMMKMVENEILLVDRIDKKKMKKLSEVSKVIIIKMYDNYYEPNKFRVPVTKLENIESCTLIMCITYVKILVYEKNFRDCGSEFFIEWKLLCSYCNLYRW